MNRTLLHRLPDIIVLALQRAHELDPRQRGRMGVRSASLRPVSEQAQEVNERGERQVTLLGGNSLSVLLGLLAGLGCAGALSSRLPFIWLQDSGAAACAEGCAVTPLQRETSQLIDLATRLFLARELLREDGWLVAQLHETPERCIERLLQTVFGGVCCLPPASPDGPQRFLVSPGARTCSMARLVVPAGTHPLPGLVQRLTRSGEPVLVLNADLDSTTWVASIDRHWIYQQADAMRLALLREHVVARQMGAGSALQPQEPDRDWAILS